MIVAPCFTAKGSRTVSDPVVHVSFEHDWSNVCNSCGTDLYFANRLHQSAVEVEQGVGNGASAGVTSVGEESEVGCGFPDEVPEQVEELPNWKLFKVSKKDGVSTVAPVALKVPARA